MLPALKRILNIGQKRQFVVSEVGGTQLSRYRFPKPRRPLRRQRLRRHPLGRSTSRHERGKLLLISAAGQGMVSFLKCMLMSYALSAPLFFVWPFVAVTGHSAPEELPPCSVSRLFPAFSIALPILCEATSLPNLAALPIVF